MAAVEHGTRLLRHGHVKQPVGPSVAVAAGFAPIIHARPDESAGYEIMRGHGVPRIVGKVSAYVAFSPLEIGQLLGYEIAVRGVLGAVGKQPRLKVIVACHVDHGGELAVVVVLPCKRSRPGRLELVHEVIEHLGTLYAFVALVPSLLHLVAYAPEDY